MAGRRAAQVRVCAEAVLGLGHADRQIAISGLFPLAKLVTDALVGEHLVGAVDALCDGLDLFEQRHVVGIDRREVADLGISDLGNPHGQFFGTLAAKLPVTRDDRLAALLGNIVLKCLHLGIGVAEEVIDGNHDRNTKALEVLNMSAKVGAAGFNSGDILGTEIGTGDTTIHLHRADSGDKDDRAWRDAGLAALDVHEFLGSEVSAETGLGHNIVGQLQRRLGRDHGITAMRDIGERAAMHEGRIVLEGLHEVRLHRLCQQHGHRAVGLDIAAEYRRTVTAVGNNDIAKTLLQIFDVGGEAENCHHLGRDGDVEAGLTREAVGYAAKAGDDVTKRAVIHIDNTAPGDAALVDVELVAPVDMVVDHRRQQVVCRGDRVEVAGEMKVHFFHRHDLGIATAGSATLHAEAGAERSLADTDGRLLADRVQTVDKADSRCGLTLAGGRRVNGGDQNQLAVGLAGLRLDEVCRDLGLVMAERQQILRRNTKFGADILDRLLGGCAGNFNIRLWAHGGGFLCVKRHRVMWLTCHSSAAVCPRRHKTTQNRLPRRMQDSAKAPENLRCEAAGDRLRQPP